MAESKIAFNFNETKPDTSTFLSRAMYFFSVTNPLNFTVPETEIVEGVNTVKQYKELAKQSPDGTIQVTPTEK